MSNPGPQKLALCINIQIFYAMSNLQPQKSTSYAILKGFHVSMSDPLPLNDELKIGLTLVHKNWTYINNQIFYAMSNLQPQKYA